MRKKILLTLAIIGLAVSLGWAKTETDSNVAGSQVVYGSVDGTRTNIKQIKVDSNGVVSTAATVSGTVTANQGTGGASAWKVDGSAVTQPVSGTFWQTTQPVSSTDLDIRDLTSASDSVEVKQATASNLKAEVSATDLDIRDLSSATDSVTVTGSVDVGTVTTLPAITGTVDVGTVTTLPAITASDLDIRDLANATDSVTAHQGGTWNIGSITTLPAITGSVTANAGTNLNTSALALDATLAKLTIGQNADLGSNTQALIGGSVTTAYPSYTTGKIQPLSLATDGTLRVRNDMNPCSSTASGQKDVASAGTDEALGASTSILSVTVKAKPTNTGYIYVGAEGVSSSTGYILSKQETVTMDVDNLADVWIDSSVNGEGVSFIYVVK